MNDSTKSLIGAIAGLGTLIEMTAIVARCSVDVARIDAQAAECAKKGGEFNRGTGEGDSFCIVPEKPGAH